MAEETADQAATLKQFMVYYFRAADLNDALASTNLQQAISSALETTVGTATIGALWQNRVWDPGGNDSYLMDIYQEGQQSFFGDLCLFSAGHKQAMIETQNTSAQFANVNQQKSPKGKEYLRSIMYWMVVNNHVLAIQSLAVGSNRLAQYLNWLLRQQTAIFAEDSVISLNSSLNADEIGGLDEVTGLVIGGADEPAVTPVPQATASTAQAEASHGTEKSRRLQGWGDTAKKVLEAIIPEPAEAESIIAEASETGSLKVFVDVRYRRKKKGMTADNDLAARLCKSLPEGQFRARGRHGKISDGDIRLHYPARIRMDGSLPDIHDVKDKLTDAYNHFVSTGKIEP